MLLLLVLLLLLLMMLQFSFILLILKRFGKTQLLVKPQLLSGWVELIWGSEKNIRNFITLMHYPIEIADVPLLKFAKYFKYMIHLLKGKI